MTKKRSEKIIEKPAGDQIYAFATCSNFPKERAGLEALAAALQRWAMETGIMMSAIVEECLASSAWCPTPFDLRGVALSMRDKIRSAKEGSKRAEWERIYGKPDPNWATNMVKLAMIRGGHKDATLASHEQAIRDMLYYTEGDGKLLGDREFWAGKRLDGLQGARSFDLTHYPELVERIRKEGGWRTERELQGITE